MTVKEMPRLSGANPNAVVNHDSADIAPPAINLQVSRLIQRCAITAATAEMLAALVYGSAA